MLVLWVKSQPKTMRKGRQLKSARALSHSLWGRLRPAPLRVQQQRNSVYRYMGRRQQNTSKLADLWLLMKRTSDYAAGNWADACWDSIYRHCEYFFFNTNKSLASPCIVRASSFDAKHWATIINGIGNKTDSTGIQLCMRPEYYPTVKTIWSVELQIQITEIWH